MKLVRQSLIPVCSALMLVAACGNATGPIGGWMVKTSLSRTALVPGDTMTIHIAVTSLLPTRTSPGSCDYPSFRVEDVSGKVVDQNAIVCAYVTSGIGTYPVAQATYLWSAKPYVCGSSGCVQVTLPAGMYRVIGEIQSPAGLVQSAPKTIQVLDSAASPVVS